jgi:microcystin-dependent protein
VICFVQNAASFGVGQIVFVAGGDYMSVQAVNTTNGTLTLQNMGLLGTAAGTNIAIGSTVSGTGPQGPQGIAGPQGPAGPQGLVGVAPTGAMFAWPMPTPPGGYLICNGQAISRTVYSALFATISTTYGVGDGTSTFNLPNLSGRVPLGSSGTHAIASTGGEETHALTTGELAIHAHSITDPRHVHTQAAHTHDELPPGHNHNDLGHQHQINYATYGAAGGAPQILSGQGGAYGMLTDVGYAILSNTSVRLSAIAPPLFSASTGITGTNNIGSGTAHNNMPPYLTINWIIKT